MLTKCLFGSSSSVMMTACPKFIPHLPSLQFVTDSIVSTGNGKPFNCRWIDCKSTGFDSQIGLVTHIERVHVETRREDFSCFWLGCSRRNRPFNARYKLLIHLRIHSGHKPNECTFEGCDKAFSRLENLKIHLRSHTGERPYVCTNPFCTKSFSNSSDRAKHQRTHIDKKPYACTWSGCAKRYTDPSSLRKHAKIHLNPAANIDKPRTKRQPKTAKPTGIDWSEIPISSSSSVFLTPSPTPSSVTSDKKFEFPEVGCQFDLGGEKSWSEVDYFDKMIKSEYYSPDLSSYYNDFDWMLYFELQDVDTILGT